MGLGIVETESDMKKQQGNGNQGNLFLSQFEAGDSVETLPHTDDFMRGDRYGMVTKVGHTYVSVSLNKSGKIKRFSPENIKHKELDNG